MRNEAHEMVIKVGLTRRNRDVGAELRGVRHYQWVVLHNEKPYNNPSAKNIY